MNGTARYTFRESRLKGLFAGGSVRYNDDHTGVRRVYLNEPRSYRLTTTVEF